MATRSGKTARRASTKRSAARRSSKRPGSMGVAKFTPNGDDALAVIGREFADVLERRELTQQEAAYIIKDAPSQISLLVTGKYRGFSLERGLSMLARLGYEIEIIAHEQSPSHAANGSISAYVQRFDKQR